MKSLVCTAAASLIALIVANVTGIIGFRYPQVVENEPLHNPIKVIRVGGNCLILADSRIIRTKSDT